MKIFINNIRLYARHGVLPQEQLVGGWFLVSVSVDTPEEHSAETDELADTVSYADIASIVQDEMALPSRLLEHVAKRIAQRLLDTFPTLSEVVVRVTKENPPISHLQCDGAGVEVRIPT